MATTGLRIKQRRHSHIVSKKQNRKRMKESMATATLLLICIWATFNAQPAESREWTDIETYHPFVAYDGRFGGFAVESDPFHFTPHPSNVPSRSPSMPPSLVPTVTTSPSRNPSKSLSPSAEPTSMPSQSSEQPSPTPSSLPTSMPSEIEFPGNEPPMFPNSSYFDYNVERDAEYGPGYPELVMHNSTYMKIQYQNNGWTTRTPPQNWYWNEFEFNGTGPWKGILGNKKISKNVCDGYEQSPIDIVENGAECFEHHEIRELRGDFTLGSGQVRPQILSNKLRLLFARRPCPEVDTFPCNVTVPPTADFPNNWGGHSDLIHVDFKIPSEHLVNGERFDAEMQIYHLHPTRRRTPTVVSLMRATHTGHNFMLQQIIDRFQFLFDTDTAQCAARTRRERRRLSKIHELLGGNNNNSVYKSRIDYKSWGDFSTAAESPNATDATTHRQLQSIFTPHDKTLVPSIYFYRYDGSLTEPPCSEFVSWFVCDVPMSMSYSQLQQLKIIQFEYVNPYCKKTSIHYRGSNARPIQDTFGRPIWRCTPKDYVADSARG